MLEKYREEALLVLSKAKHSNFSKCTLAQELSITENSEVLSSTLYGSCIKSSYDSFTQDLPPLQLTEVVANFSLSPGSECPELELYSSTQELMKVIWSKEYYCIAIWSSKSQQSPKLLRTLTDLAMHTKNVEIVSICLDSSSEVEIDNIISYNVQGLAAISGQGIEISEIPCFLLLKHSKIHSVLDLSKNLLNEVNYMLDGKPCKTQVNVGSILDLLTLSSSVLQLNDNSWHLILFPGTENEYFLRHLAQIQDEDSELSEAFKVTVIEKADIDCIEINSAAGVFFIVNKGVVVLKCDTSCTDIYHTLKNLLHPKPLSRDEFQERKSRFEFSQSLWQSKYPACPKPTVLFTFSKKFFFNNESTEEKQASLEGSYLTVQKECIDEFFEMLTSFFPYAVNRVSYEAPSHTISPGEQCSKCDELLEKTHYLCVYCKPALYFCENCTHPHPVFRFTMDVAGLDHLTWGAFNLNVEKVEDGIQLDILCNSCKEKISGVRWKCAICNDFDICGPCVKEGKSHEKTHILIRIP